MKVVITILVLVTAAFAVTPSPVPNNTIRGITVGAGWVEATNHHVVRTSADVVYIIASDDSPCLTSGSGVIRVYKGSGANATNPLVPTSFSEVDAAHHPVSPNSGGCQFSAGSVNLLFAPDVRLDASGIIHIAYIDPVSNNNGIVYYQTFSTATNLWGTRTQIATGAETTVGGSWPRGSHCVLTLDSTGVPYVAWATSGSSNAIQWSAKTAAGGTAFTAAATISGSSGTDEFQPSIVTAIDGTIHLAWIDNALAAHSVIKYAKFSSGSWSAVETVSSGDNNVLGDGDHDQMPSIVTDAQSRPFVLYNDGTVNGADNDIRQRFRTAANTWVDDTAPGTSGASNASGTWFNHTSQNYISSSGDVYIFLGHDVNVSPGPFSYQVGGPGNNWSAVTQLDPCNTTTVTSGEAGCDGSMSIRFDPIRPGRTNIIDLVYYDENDGTVAGNHHGTIFYKAVDIGDTGNMFIDGGIGSCTRSASVATYDATKGCATVLAAWTAASAGDLIIAKGCNSAVATCTNGAYSAGFSATGAKASTVTIQAASGENAWFAGDGSISSATNLTVQDDRPGISQGLTMGVEVVSGTSSNITMLNVDNWCQNSAPWHLVTGQIGTLCTAYFYISGVNGLFRTGGFIGPVSDCFDAPCSGSDINKISACASNAACNNINFTGVTWHDMTNMDTTCSTNCNHNEMIKIDQGQNITFTNDQFIKCNGSSISCNSAVIFFGQSGNADTSDFITFIGNVIGPSGGGGNGLQYGYDFPQGTAKHLTFRYNTIDGTLGVDPSHEQNNNLPGTNLLFEGNVAFKQSFGGCVSGASYIKNEWYSNGGIQAQCGTDNAGFSNPPAFYVSPGSPNYNYHLRTGSALIGIGGSGCAGLTDLFGTSRPQGANCAVGAAEFTSGAPQVATPTFSPVAGTYPSAQTVTITSSTTSATICYTADGTAPTANGAGTCTHGTTLANGGTVTVSSSETVQALGSLSGDTDSAVGSATYTIGIPVASLSPASLSFGGINNSNTSAPQTLTLQNTGTAVMSITSISLAGANTGDFFQSNNCPVGSNLGNGSSCTITVTFTPLAVGSRTASVSVVDGASGSPHTSALSGSGVQPSIASQMNSGVRLSGRVVVK